MDNKFYKENNRVKLRYGLRKLSVGVVSLMIGATVFYGAVAQTNPDLKIFSAVNAEEVTEVANNIEEAPTLRNNAGDMPKDKAGGNPAAEIPEIIIGKVDKSVKSIRVAKTEINGGFNNNEDLVGNGSDEKIKSALGQLTNAYDNTFTILKNESGNWEFENNDTANKYDIILEGGDLKIRAKTGNDAATKKLKNLINNNAITIVESNSKEVPTESSNSVALSSTYIVMGQRPLIGLTNEEKSVANAFNNPKNTVEAMNQALPLLVKKNDSILHSGGSIPKKSFSNATIVYFPDYSSKRIPQNELVTVRENSKPATNIEQKEKVITADSQAINGSTVKLMDGTTEIAIGTLNDGKITINIPENKYVSLNGKELTLAVTEPYSPARRGVPDGNKFTNTDGKIVLHSVAPAPTAINDAIANNTAVKVILPEGVKAGDKLTVKVGEKQVTVELTEGQKEAIVNVDKLVKEQKVEASISDVYGNISASKDITVADVDKTELKKEIEAANEVKKNTLYDKLPEEGVKKELETALTEGNQTNDDENATQADVNSKKDKLEKAIEAVKAKLEETKQALQKAKDEANQAIDAAKKAAKDEASKLADGAEKTALLDKIEKDAKDAKDKVEAANTPDEANTAKTNGVNVLNGDKAKAAVDVAKKAHEVAETAKKDAEKDGTITPEEAGDVNGKIDAFDKAKKDAQDIVDTLPEADKAELQKALNGLTNISKVEETKTSSDKSSKKSRKKSGSSTTTPSTPSTGDSTTATDKNRVAGSNRVETAVKVSKLVFPNGSDVVILVHSDKYTDALAATPYAKLMKAPLLFTDVNSIPEQTMQELKRLGAKKVIIIGGKNSVSMSIQDLLNKNYNVDRIDGRDRYETAKLIADRMMKMTGNKEVIIASGEIFPDALSISSLAVKKEIPILLTRSNELPNFTNQALENYKGIDQIYVVGGQNTVSDNVHNKVKTYTQKAITKFAGANRYETSAIVAEKVMPFSGTGIFASGEVFPDALLSGILVNTHDAPVLLVKKDSLPAPIVKHLKNSSIEKHVIVGGENTISSKVVEEITTAKKR